MSTSDRELLELAARAISGKLESDFYMLFRFDGEIKPWSPLEDDGDALRLAAALRIDLSFYNGFEEVHAEQANGDYGGPQIEKYGNDVGACARRAIVRAAAEIGKSDLKVKP